MQARLFSVPAIKIWTVVFLFPLMASVVRCTGQTNAFAPPHSNLHPPREVLAFYYPWYGKTRHWGKADAANHDIQNSRHYPAQGAYDSHDPAIITRQISEAQTHHVTGLISSWWGQGTYEDQAVPLLLAAAGAKHFNISVYWEAAPGKGGEQIDRAVSDLTYLLTRYGTNDAFLKVDGLPVIFVYGRVMGQVPFAAWPEILRRARSQAGNFLLVADGYSARNARQFDGLHTYNICGQVKGKTPDELRTWAAAHYARAVKLARDRGDISCVTVIPGYDDTKIRKPGLDVDRLDGQVYRVLWDEAIKARPDWVLITSWNEWHEGSEIEPSFEDGGKYLKLTGEYALRFLRGERP
jgi:glycoprotein endo-alpha-1,2-mannosidase